MCLGYIITADLRNDSHREIERQRRVSIDAQGNMLVRKFYMCSGDVKAHLFRTYPTPMYTAHLWWSYNKGSMRKVNITYNDVMRILLHLPRYQSASQMCMTCRVRDCWATFRNLIYMFVQRCQ